MATRHPPSVACDAALRGIRKLSNVLCLAAFVAPALLAMPAGASNRIVSQHVSSLCLGDRSGTAVLGSCSDSIADFSGYGEIRSHDRCLTSHSRGQALTWSTCTNGAAQRWAIQSNGQLNNEAGWCADVERQGRAQGTQVIAYDCPRRGTSTPSNQKWTARTDSAQPAVAGLANRAPTLDDVRLALRTGGGSMTLGQVLDFASRSGGVFGVNDVLRIISTDGSSFSRDGIGKIISQDGGTFQVKADGRLISQDGGSFHIVNGIISQDGGSLIGNAGGALISNNAAPLVGNSGGTVVPRAAPILTDQGAGVRRLQAVPNCNTAWVNLLLDTARPTTRKDSGDSGECATTQYTGGAWQRNLTQAEQDRVKARLSDPAFQQVVLAILSQSAPAPVAADGPCRDPYVSRALREVTGTEPTGTGDQGDCDYRHYNGGTWKDYPELHDAVIVYRKAFNEPILQAQLDDYNRRHGINTQAAASSSQYQQIGSALGSNFQSLKVVDNPVCLTVSNPSPGQAVFTAGCNGSAAQQFRFNGSAIVANVKANGRDLCLDAGRGGEDDVVTVQPCGGGGGQSWSKDGDRIKSSGGRVLDPGPGNGIVTVRTAVPGVKAQQWTATGTPVAPAAPAPVVAQAPTPAPVTVPTTTPAPVRPPPAPVQIAGPAPTPVVTPPAGPNCSNSMLTAALKANGRGTAADTGTSGLCNPSRYRGADRNPAALNVNQPEINDLVKQSFYCQDPWIGEIWAEREQNYRQLSSAPQLCNIKLYNNGSWNGWDQLRQFIQDYHRKNPNA